MNPTLVQHHNQPDTPGRITITLRDVQRGPSRAKVAFTLLSGLFFVAGGLGALWWIALPERLSEGEHITLQAGAKTGLDALATGTVTLEATSNTMTSQGSGCIIEIDGSTALIATNWHVVAPPTPKACGTWTIDSLQHGTSVGRAVAVHVPTTPVDLAILEVELTDAARQSLETLPTLAASDDTLEPLTPVVVVGSPQGYEHTYTEGKVSATRDTAVGRIIQIDANVWPGSSGGPVFVRSPEDTFALAGIVTAKSPFGINFAIHIDELRTQEFTRHRATPPGWADAMEQME
ncbi:MAG: serine protease [Phycisphaerales bacterium]|nr:serine protease [Phycisphaerales bacterium]